MTKAQYRKMVSLHKKLKALNKQARELVAEINPLAYFTENPEKQIGSWIEQNRKKFETAKKEE